MENLAEHHLSLCSTTALAQRNSCCFLRLNELTAPELRSCYVEQYRNLPAIDSQCLAKDLQRILRTILRDEHRRKLSVRPYEFGPVLYRKAIGFFGFRRLIKVP